MGQIGTGHDRLAGLRPAYLSRLQARVEQLEEFVSACGTRAPSPQERAVIHRSVHSMISSAAIFGHQAVSQSARKAEQVFDRRDAPVGDLAGSVADVVREARAVLYHVE